MKSLLPSIEKESAYLRRIPAFDPRFRQAYGAWGLSGIGVLSLVILGLGIWWLAPWNSGYLPEERKSIWFGVAVMPFASFLAAVFIVEFVLKLVHVALWIRDGSLSVPTEAKFAAWIFGVLAAAAVALPVLHAEWDLWGYLALFLSIPVLYAFLQISWDATFGKKTPNQSPEPMRAKGPHGSSWTLGEDCTMSDQATYEVRAAAAAIAKGHAEPQSLRDLLIWTTSGRTAASVEEYFRRHLHDEDLLRSLFTIALEGEDSGDAPWAAANVITEFPASMLTPHREELIALSQFEWDYLRQPALKALAKIDQK